MKLPTFLISTYQNGMTMYLSDYISLQVKALKLEIENAGSDNQVKDLEQKLAGALTEVEDASFRIQR